MFGEHMRDLATVVTCPWIFMGDLNDIGLVEERKGGAPVSLNKVLRFRENVNACNLLDAGCVGWVRKQHGRIVIQERLDRVNTEHFPEAKVINLPRTCSDHSPILASMSVLILLPPPDPELRPF